MHGKKLRGFTDKAKRALLSYTWPGNIRELQNVIERSVIIAPHGTRIEASHLFLAERDDQPAELGLDAHGELLAQGWQPGERLCESVLNGVFTLDEVESMLLEAAVAKAKGNLSSAARLLGVTRPQLAYRLKRMKEADKAVVPKKESRKPPVKATV